MLILRALAPSIRRENVLLVVVDTLRADRLGCYGWREETSPNLDRLAAEGALFEQMMCQVPQTLPSLCSILTGRFPVSHGVRVNGMFALPAAAETLAETLRERGYRTAAYVGAFPLDRRFGLDQGFAVYDDEMKSERTMAGLPRNEGGEFDWRGHRSASFENTADVVTERALRGLESVAGEPFFLLVHYFDPHHDYDPPSRLREDFRHPYSGEVAFADEQLGRLLAKLEELGLTDETIVAFTGDHGECLGERGRKYHQTMLVDAAIHVPFVIRAPGRIRPGVSVSGLAQSVDIMPTLLDLLGVSAPDAVEGTSLVPSIAVGATENRPCFFETLYGRLEVETASARTRVGVRVGSLKLIRNEQLTQDGEPEVSYELYDVNEDPLEARNLARRRPDELERLRAVLERFEREHPPGRADVTTPDEDAIEKLRALGYF